MKVDFVERQDFLRAAGTQTIINSLMDDCAFKGQTRVEREHPDGAFINISYDS